MITIVMPNEGWAKKAAEWKPGLSAKTRTHRSVGRLRKRWENDVNEFVRPGETEETRGNDVRNSDTWIKITEDQRSWKQMESEIAMTVRQHHMEFGDIA